MYLAKKYHHGVHAVYVTQFQKWIWPSPFTPDPPPPTTQDGMYWEKYKYAITITVSVTHFQKQIWPSTLPLILHPLTTHTWWHVLGKTQLCYQHQCHSTSRNLTLNFYRWHFSSYSLNHRRWYVLEEIPAKIWPSTFTPDLHPPNHTGRYVLG